MSTPFLSEIRIFSFNYAPKGWALCDGQLMAINQNQALFSLLGTTYGGDGRVNFALPNLKGNVPLHEGNGFSLGQRSGQAAHTLSVQEMPGHTHTLTASNDTATVAGPNGAYLATTSSGIGPIYSGAAPQLNATLNAGSISNTGNSQPHENRQPYLVLNFSIALQGIFPSQT